MVRPAKVKVEGGPVRALAGPAQREAGAKPRHAAEKTVETRQQDGKIERLGQIIVGAGAESVEHVFGTAARGEHQDGNEILLRPQLRGDGKAISSGKHDVQDDGIDGSAAIISSAVSPSTASCTV